MFSDFPEHSRTVFITFSNLKFVHVCSTLFGRLVSWSWRFCVQLPVRFRRSASSLRHTVEGAAVGQEFLLFFTGAVGFIPFERVHLPAFVLPRLHAPLSGLLSANPLVGQRIRKSASPPVAHPGRFRGSVTTQQSFRW